MDFLNRQAAGLSRHRQPDNWRFSQLLRPVSILVEDVWMTTRVVLISGLTPSCDLLLNFSRRGMTAFGTFCIPSLSSEIAEYVRKARPSTYLPGFLYPWSLLPWHRLVATFSRSACAFQASANNRPEYQVDGNMPFALFVLLPTGR
jgi:hypothetical protein